MKTKPNLSLYSPYYAEACNEFAVPISASQRQGNTATCVHVEVLANRLQQMQTCENEHVEVAPNLVTDLFQKKNLSRMTPTYNFVKLHRNFLALVSLIGNHWFTVILSALI